MIRGRAISWSSKRQPTIALSTTKAEYMANVSHKRSHMDNKIDDGFNIMEEKKVMVIRCDNQGAISLTKNPTHHA